GPVTKVNVLGGGPAGLFFAILLKKHGGGHEVTVFERGAPDDAFGWGIVFSDRTLAFLQDSDADAFARVSRAAQTWDNVDVIHKGEKVSVRGNGFSGVSRLAFLQILQERCRELGVDIRFGAAVGDPSSLLDADLLLGADGTNSAVRRTWSDFFQPSIDVRRNRFIWLGTRRLFHGLVMIFREAEAGLFIAHAYKFDPATSTFIVEASPETWARAGFAAMS